MGMQSICCMGPNGNRRRVCYTEGSNVNNRRACDDKKIINGNGTDNWKEWWDSLELSMKEAAEEEKKLAIAQGSYHEDVPAITVIVDGGWQTFLQCQVWSRYNCW